MNLTLLLIIFLLLIYQMVEAKFVKLLNHSKILLRKQWLYGIVDDFVTKQLPHNVTWGISLLYALEHKGDRALTSTQGYLSSQLFHSDFFCLKYLQIYCSFGLCNRRASTCSTVLGFSGVTELHSLRRHS